MNNSPELIDLRRNSADWQEAIAVSTGLILGQQSLDTKDLNAVKARLDAMQPQYRDRLLQVVRNWVSAQEAADRLVRDIEADLQRSA